MENNYIIIATEGATTMRYSLSSDINGKTIARKFRPQAAVGAEETAATRINTLHDIVNVMKKIDTKSTFDKPITIIANDNCIKLIYAGTPKFWFSTGGKTLAGTDINATEMNLWAEFYSLYAKNIMKVCFKKLGDYTSLQKTTKFTVTAEQKLVIRFINEAWKETKTINQSLSTIEEEEVDEI